MKFKIQYSICSLLLLTLLTSCYNQERNCKDFKTGKFTSETEIEGKKYTEEYKYSYTSQNLLSSIPEENMLKCRKAYCVHRRTGGLEKDKAA